MLISALRNYFRPQPSPPMPAGEVELHPRGHAHNDEMQPHPLGDALNAGFTSIEVDTHVIDGKLLVGHSPRNARRIGQSLEESYFAPLHERVKKYGAVYYGGPPVTLLLDFKADGEKTYQALLPILEKYQGMLCHYRGGQEIPGPLKVVISGEQPHLSAAELADRSVFFDAKVGDPISPELTPLVSGDYKELLRWKGRGDMSEADQGKLQKLVADAHEHGARLRLWNAPDKPAAWEVLEKAGVDFINTDKLGEFASWQDQHCRTISSPSLFNC